jgi:hypothetical protein
MLVASYISHFPKRRSDSPRASIARRRVAFSYWGVLDCGMDELYIVKGVSFLFASHFQG